MSESSPQYPPARLFQASFGNTEFALAAVAHDVIVALRPRVVVELGAGFATPSMALCQAMEENGTAGTCFAVDAWTEEENWSVVQNAVAHGRSGLRLIRATPEAAAGEFAAGSVGLLYFRVPPTETAVDSWLARMQPGGVILIGGILPGAGSPEARMLWQKLRREFESCFELPVDNGIGIVRIAGGPKTFVDQWFSTEAGGAFLSHYYSLVARVAGLLHSVQTQDGELARQSKSLRLELRQAQVERTGLAAEYRTLHARIASLTEQIARQEERLTQQKELAAEELLRLDRERASERRLAEQELKKIAEHWSQAQTEADTYRAESERLAGELARAKASAAMRTNGAEAPARGWEQERQQLQAALEDRQRALSDMKNSLSWRLTAPLRAVAEMLAGHTGRRSE